ncbi:hypothetical protein K3179_10195 [Qipengyuania sp. GH38]|uniref:hypothetical protein n=1 Tax=Qipengyuania intermedia TaxID=2867244 RepID=UPI001C8888A2|nr:hypothetical protein [Qipengyuania intermedia]MBX7514911.1 hypothetical protein [Qipengyuania intermedia]
MASTKKRDNTYWAARLKKDGHDEILDRYETGEFNMYRARQLAGYLAEKPSSIADRLSHHWQRADVLQREKFLIDNMASVLRSTKDVQARGQRLKAKKPSE